ncbi:MAG: hypothetical protein LBH46_03860 [Rickettsiales bacterium]|jgi:hypothetical protein|nr:hypothetical protein [Rickettsiales bacterium]
MNEDKLIHFLVDVIPKQKRVQFVRPYINEAPAPVNDYYTIYIIDVNTQSAGRIENEYIQGKLTQSIKTLKEYTIQYDFIGDDALINALSYSDMLQKLTGFETKGIGFLNVTPVKNLTFLQSNKDFKGRYGFDLHLSVVDSVDLGIEQDVLEKITVECKLVINQ